MIRDAGLGRGPNINIFARKGKTHWALVIFSVLSLIVGQATSSLLNMYYFNDGGNSRWISTLVQSVGCPIIFIPLVFYQGKKASKITQLTPKLVLIYVGLLMGYLLYACFDLFTSLFKPTVFQCCIFIGIDHE